MGRNKLSKALEKVAREKGLICEKSESRAGKHMMVCFTKPPTVNNLFLSAGRRRVKTPEYREWIRENTDEAKELKSPPSYPIIMCYRLCGNFNSQSDGANYEKPVVDILVSERVIANDNLKHIIGGRWEYAPSEADPTVLVWWEEPK